MDGASVVVGTYRLKDAAEDYTGRLVMGISPSREGILLRAQDAVNIMSLRVATNQQDPIPNFTGAGHPVRVRAHLNGPAQ